MYNSSALTHVGEQDFVDGMGKLGEGHVSFLHVLVQITDGGGDTPPLGLETAPFEKSSPVTFKTIDVPVGLDREVLENPPLFELSEEGTIDDALVNNIEPEKLVDKLVINEFTEDSPGDHLEGKDRDEFLGFDDQFVVLLFPDYMGEMRQGLEPFVRVADHDGEEFGGFLRGEMWIDMGSEPSPVLIVLDANALTEDSAHVLSETNIWDFEVDLGITVVESANVIRIGQNASIDSFSGNLRGRT